MPRSAAPLTSAPRPIAGADQDEIRVALPVRAARADRTPRTAAPSTRAPAAGSRRDESRSAERGLHRDDRGDVHAVDRDRRARIGSSASGAPTRQPMRRPARPYAFENVRPTITLGNAAQLRDERRRRRTRRTPRRRRRPRPAARAARSSRIASSGIATPVGIVRVGQEDDARASA